MRSQCGLDNHLGSAGAQGYVVAYNLRVAMRRASHGICRLAVLHGEWPSSPPSFCRPHPSREHDLGVQLRESFLCGFGLHMRGQLRMASTQYADF